MARKKFKSATDQRKFIMIYHDFLESDLLTSHEKMVFIALKKFADSNNQCFPSLKKLADVTRISKRKIQDTLKSLEQKHIIGIESRSRADGGDTSNLYTLYDFKELWNASSSEEMAAVVNEYEEMKLVSELRSRGYTVTKEKELASTEPTKVTAETSTKQFNQFDIVNTTTNSVESQDLERYTLDQIKQLFDYDIMIQDNPYRQQDIDSVMNILYTTMNTTKTTIRIAGEDKPSMVVVGKLMKLHKESIMYAIEKFSEQTERIKNPTSYMLTILYNAPEQFNLDIQNQVSHDMAHWNTEE